jgi:hypothetical protein
VVLLFATWSGTFAGGARAIPVAVGWLALVPLVWLGSARIHDPLGLGGLGAHGLVGLLPWMAWSWALLSWQLSPVSRAGRIGVAATPLLLLAVAGVWSCWSRERARAAGALALALGAAALSAYALIDGWLAGRERPALPLGHHNLLALWLLGASGAILSGVARSGAAGLAHRVAGGLLIVAVLASRSLAGLGGVLAMVVAWWWLARLGRNGARGTVPVGSTPFGSTPFGSGRKSRRLLGLGLALGALVVVAGAPRAWSIVTLHDVSTAARLGYAQAAVRASLTQPLVGWGPGSSAWLLSEWLEPQPGTRPASEVVTDPHSLPLDLAFELGWIGMAIAMSAVVALCFGLAKRARTIEARGWLCGLMGLGAALVGSGVFDVTAIPVVAAAVAGGALAATAPAEPPLKATRSQRTLVATVLAFALVAIVPAVAAHVHYGRALLETEAVAARDELARALRWDPAHPLPHLRLAFLPGRAASQNAQRAARTARGLAPLWLAAGNLGGWAAGEGTGSEHQAQSAAALERACRLDPLAPTAPFLLARAMPDHPLAASRAARALVAEPRLAAATLFLERPDLLEDATALLANARGLPSGWRRRALERFGPLAGGPGERSSSDGEGRSRESITVLELALDTEDQTSLSLFAFRRPRRPLVVAQIELDSRRLAVATFAAAASLTATSPQVFPPECVLGTVAVEDVDAPAVP